MKTKQFRPLDLRVWDGEKLLERDGSFEAREIGCGILHDIPNAKILLFSGLTDSAGTKVYEGDIVQSKEEPAVFGAIYFAAGTFMIDGDGPLYDHVFSLSPDRLEDYLVVGNIFENPEILKRRKHE